MDGNVNSSDDQFKEERIKHEGRKTVKKNFAVLCLVAFTLLSGYGSILVLQSSINIERGIGVWSLMATYIGGALFNLLFTPVVITKIGVRTTMLISESTYLIYCLANFYPEAYLLIPAGLLVGFGEACMWPCMMIYILYFAQCYARYAPKSSAFYGTQLLGYFFSCVTLCQMFGNLITWAILYGGALSDANAFNSTSNGTCERDVSVCGKNDCQDPNITEANIEQYEPANQVTRYSTIAAMSALVFLSIIILACFLPEIELLRKDSNASSKGPEVPQTFDILKNTFRHLLSVKQLLLTPYALYAGLFLSYNYSEMTRAFVSCLRGVDQVSLYIVCSNAVDGVMAIVVGQLAAKYGRNILMVIAFLLNVGWFLIQLFWVPTFGNSWFVYLLAVVYGVIDSIYGINIQDIHGAFFPRRKEFALSAANMYNTLGWGIQYAWSTSLCVETKIYILLGVLTLSIICFGVANAINTNDLLHDSTISPSNEDDDAEVKETKL